MTDEAARARFVRRYGVLGWGLSTGAGFALLMGLEFGYGASWWLFTLPFSLIAFAFAGRYWGRFMWRVMQTRKAEAEA